jgi:cell division GTPase FtsZ
MSENVTIKQNEPSSKVKSKDEIELENQALLRAFDEHKKDGIRSDAELLKEKLDKIEQEKQKLIQGHQPVSTSIEPKLNLEKLEVLRAKLNEKSGVKMPTIVSKKEVSINMGIVGLGQAGSRIAEEFHKLGYDVGVINTSSQDLNAISLPETQKLLLDGSLGGTGKDRLLSRTIFESNQEQVLEFIKGVAEGNDMIYTCASLGGGSGSGSISFVSQLAKALEMPVGVIAVLPKHSEGSANKKNSLEALSELADLVASNQIDSLIVVDNARLEVLLSDVGHGHFWQKSNEMIVRPLTRLNYLTSTSTAEALDPSDFGKILTGGGLTVYGTLKIDNYMDETALAEAVIKSLSDNMLSEGFDLSKAVAGGVIFVGSEKAINEIPSINLDYAQSMISEVTNGANLYRGIYIDESLGDTIEVVSMFSGLGLPETRINDLQTEVSKLDSISKEKEAGKVASITLGLAKPKTDNLREEIHKKIQTKNSGFNKLQSKSIIDRRKR